MTHVHPDLTEGGALNACDATQRGEHLAGLMDLVLAYGAACRREGAAIVRNRTTPEQLAAITEETNRLRVRVVRRVRRLELLADMGGIEPSDVRGALTGTWRN